MSGQLARVGVGSSTLAPASGDRRFTDPAWTANPLLRRLVQAHLAAAGTAEGLVADADLEWRDGERMRLLVENVVLRTPMFELLQYRPPTAKVRRVPLLVVPPTINKCYIVDLAPGRSLVEYLVASGQQVFVVSWRNPDARHRDWGADDVGWLERRGGEKARPRRLGAAGLSPMEPAPGTYVLDR